ncbi:MAG: DUF1549 and DUF1553 domain-containing protein [Gemmataceae bacterium]|nr:DUF1549 and DUF1553 domain-containing protein [Gemmataceae bacterium]
MRPSLRTFTLLAVFTLPVLPGAAHADPPVSFRNEVMPVLARAGCNQGTCHGNLNGKGGFKLSLRGQDPALDLDALTRDSLGRRTDPHAPEASLILQKPTARVPHEGGQRFPVNSPEYRLLRRWIAEGMRSDLDRAPAVTRLDVTPAETYLGEPRDTLTVRAVAVFADGTRKDVAGLAVFESTNPKIDVSRDGVVRGAAPEETTIVVRFLDRQATAQLAFVPARPDFVWSNPSASNYIDEHVFGRLRKLRINPSELCSDSEFLRRAYLDLLGVLPTPEEVRRFLADARTDKRSWLVDDLLRRPEFADYWALHFADVLRNEEKQLDRKGVRAFHRWIRESIASDKPLNEFARELIGSRGSTYSEPAANYYRALRDPYIRAEATAQVFLGLRMQCAKCHNHPFNSWTQNDYHQLAAFFARVQYRIIENNRRDKLDKHEFIGEQIVYMDDKSEVKHPTTGEVLRPRFLGGTNLPVAKVDRLRALADWVADERNPFFARTQANRIWSYLLGRGIVDPNDDFRESNPPANAPLLDALARDFREHRFDLKHLIRTIMNSRTYQLSAVPNATNEGDETNFSRALIRSLPAEPLLDAVTQVTDVPVEFEGYPVGLRATQLPGMPVARRKQGLGDGFKFLRVFGKPERLLNCDCERNDNTTMAQALQFITGPVVNRAISEPDNRLGQLLKAGRSNGEIIEELFLAGLCRPPSAAERTALVARVERAMDRRAALEDVLWGLLNSKEFLLRK